MNFIRKGSLAMILSLLLFLAVGCGTQGSQTESPTPAGQGSPTTSTTPSPNSSDSAPPVAAEQSSGHGTDTSSKPDQAPKGIKVGQVTAVRIIDPSSGWVGGEGWIARTEDGGTHWKLQYQGEEALQQLFALNGEDAWAVFGKSFNDPNGLRLVQTTDGGKHWAPVGKLPNDGFLHFTSTKEAFAANAHSMDGGKTWTSLSIPKQTIGDAYFHDKNHGWAVVQENNAFVVKRTINGGKTWSTVMSRNAQGPLNGAIIRSAGVDDAWVECIGDSGMTQTSYSLFHTSDGGKNWQTVIANSTAGGGPAPGFTNEQTKLPHNEGSKPGPLYVVNTSVAFMGGYCPACDNSNTIGWTLDGGKTWNNSKAQFPGFSGALLAMADAKQGWWITTDNSNPSVMYTTSDGGMHWKKAYTFKGSLK